LEKLHHLFTTATSIQRQAWLPHFGLALVDAGQGHYASAIPHLQRVTELQPKAGVAYYALSDCALGLEENKKVRNMPEKRQP